MTHGAALIRVGSTTRPSSCTCSPPFQAWHDEPSYLTARVVMVVIALGWGRRRLVAGWKACSMVAGFVAAAATAVATTHVAYSRMAVTDVPLTLGVTVALALMVVGRIELAGIAVGLAASAKYPGLILLAPLVAVAWGQWRRLAIAGGAASRSPLRAPT